MRTQSIRPQAAETDDARGAAGALLVIVTIATLVGGALRFVNLGQREMWLDESCTWYFTRDASPFDFHTGFLLYENASRLYYMLLAGWTGLFGDAAWDLRSFSAVVGTLTIPLAALWIRAVAGNVPAAFAAVVVAVHPLHVYYSREARFYPLWMVELIGLLWCGWLAARTDRRRYWAAYAVLFLAALWTHYFTAFFGPAALAFLLLREQGQPRRWRRWLVANAVVAGLFAPWFLAVVVRVSGRGNGDWIEAPFHGFPPAAAIPKTFAAFAPAGFYPYYVGLLQSASEAVPVAAYAGLVCMILAAAAFLLPSKRSGPCLSSRARVFYITCAVLPLLVAWMYSLARAPVYLVARYDQVAWPATIVILAVGLAELARRVRVGGMAAVVCCGVAAVLPAGALSVWAVHAVADAPQRNRQFLLYVRQLCRPGDEIIALGMRRWELAFDRAMVWPDSPPFHSFPFSSDEHVGWVSPRRQLGDREGLKREAAYRAVWLRRTMPPGATVWVFTQGYDIVRGQADPAFQVDDILVKALETAGAVDSPTDSEAPLLALRWPGGVAPPPPLR